MGNNSGNGFGFNSGGASGGHTTDTNIANADLTLDGAHTTDVGANTLTFDSGSSNIVQMVGSDDTLQVGGANPYKLPTQRYGIKGGVIQSSDTTTGTAFVENGFTIPFRMYADGLNSENWWYPEPMTNNKALALTRDSGFSVLSLITLTPPNVLRSAIALPGGSGATLRDMTVWASCVDTLGSETPDIQVKMMKFTPVNGDLSDLDGTDIVSLTTPSGDNNSKLYRGTALATTQASVLSKYDFLLPAFRISFRLAPDTIDCDVYINGSISLYYNS